MHAQVVVAKEKINVAVDHLKNELKQLRTGRANPALVEHLIVDAYGSKTPLRELASITTPEVRQILIQPWDVGIIKDVEKAITTSALGLNPTVDGHVLRVNLPDLTEERRKELIKIMNVMLEKSRVAIRSTREDILKDVKKQEREGEISEDELFAAQKDLQKIIDDTNEGIKKLGEEKEKDIMTI